MPYRRRTTDRRRRVLYSTRQAESAPATTSRRRAEAKLREARNPDLVYGSRVNHQLRARWFSLVPVRRRSMLAVSLTVAGVAAVLCFAHYFAATRPWFAEYPEVARPLRLDRPDSFGRWLLCLMLGLSVGISFLIYQLRRHRSDDFQGHYQIWRLLTFVMLIASVHSLTGLIEWGGAVIDAVVGKRVALTGQNWLRIVAAVGGAIAALRLIAEVRRCRTALPLIGFALLFFSIPEMFHWNVFKLDSVSDWTLATTAPLIACTCLFLGLIGYLRMVYRQVRRIRDTETFTEKVRKLRTQVLGGYEDDYQEEERAEDLRPRKRGWFGRRRHKEESPEEEGEVEKPTRRSSRRQRVAAVEESEVTSEAEAEVVADELQPTKKRRGWFGSRRTTAAVEDTESEVEAQDSEGADQPPRRRRGWSLRLKPRNSPADSGPDEVEEPEEAEEEANEEVAELQPRKKRFSLSWRKRKSDPELEDEESEEDSDSGDAYTDSEPVHPSEDEMLDSDEIDWDSLSKSERRRLRKRMKKQRRAA